MKVSTSVFALLIMLLSEAYGGTVVVPPGGDLKAAIDAANAAAGPDTLVLEGANYAIPTATIDDTLTITNAGQALNIGQVSGNKELFLLGAGFQGVFSIVGSGNRIRLLQSGGISNSNLIRTATDTSLSASVVLQNVVLEKPNSGLSANGAFIFLANSGTQHRLTNVGFVGGDPAFTGGALFIGHLFTHAATEVQLQHVDFSLSTSGGPRVLLNKAHLQSNDCIFARSGAGLTPIEYATILSDPSFTDSTTLVRPTLESGNSILINGSGHTRSLTLINPTLGAFDTSTASLIYRGITQSTITVKGSYVLTMDPQADTDFDGMSDQWEIAGALDPFSSSLPNGPGDDPDADGFTNLEEFNAQTNPTDSESNSAPHVPVADIIGLTLLALAFIAAGTAALRHPVKKEGSSTRARA